MTSDAGDAADDNDQNDGGDANGVDCNAADKYGDDRVKTAMVLNHEDDDANGGDDDNVSDAADEDAYDGERLYMMDDATTREAVQCTMDVGTLEVLCRCVRCDSPLESGVLHARTACPKKIGNARCVSIVTECCSSPTLAL